MAWQISELHNTIAVSPSFHSFSDCDLIFSLSYQDCWFFFLIVSKIYEAKTLCLQIWDWLLVPYVMVVPGSASEIWDSLHVIDITWRPYTDSPPQGRWRLLSKSYHCLACCHLVKPAFPKPCGLQTVLGALKAVTWQHVHLQPELWVVDSRKNK